jgi:hypothetical protein
MTIPKDEAGIRISKNPRYAPWEGRNHVYNGFPMEAGQKGFVSFR